MTRYYVCEHHHTAGSVVYREYPSQVTAERAARGGVPVTYTVVAVPENAEVAG